MEKQPISEKLIRFQDCDPMGHLNNARYIDYFMNAREDHLSDHYALNIYDIMRNEGRAWVVGKNEILYRTPALLMENVKVRTQVIHYSKRKILVEMAMFNNEMSHLKSLMWSIFIPVDVRSQKSSEHEADIMELLENVIVPIEEKHIEERLQRIESEITIQTA